MSKTPTRTPNPAGRPSTGTRAFQRARKLERQRAARRRTTRLNARSPTNVRALLRCVPRAAWIVAAIALLNATVWSLIIPPFQGRDEISHFAYVAQLAETGTLPHRGNEQEPFAPAEAFTLLGLHYYEVRFAAFTPSISSVAEQQTLTNDVDRNAPRTGAGEAGPASSEPPLYYTVETIPYALGGGNVLTQLQLMRLSGAVMGAITALLIFFFLREVVPGVPWAATVAAICVALQPLFAFMSGSVNPDALLYMLSAATFLCLARAFRRRFTWQEAVVLGLVVAAGFLTYFSFIGVALGACVGLAILGVRNARRSGRRALQAPAIAIGIAISPAVLYGGYNLLRGRSAFGQASSVGSTIGFSSLTRELSYIWQMYLPRLPGMTSYFAGVNTWKDIWFDRSVGFYGWMDTMFPSWVDSVALVAAIVVAVLCGRELYARRQALGERLPELASYAAITLGVLLMLGIASYSDDQVEHELSLGEPRYLLPMLALFAAAIALAIRGTGRRWMSIAGAAMVLLFLGHDIFSQLQVIARYYGT